jgi:serine/threonine-protein kinase
VGVSLYELVTGKRPFDGDSQFAIMSAHLKNTPIPPVALDPTLPQALNDVILLSVAKDPNARFQGAAAFRNALGSVVPAAAVPSPMVAAAAPPPAMPTAPLASSPHLIQPTAPERPRSRRGLWMALGGIATAAVVIAAIELAPWRGTKAAPQPPATPAAVQMPASTPAATPPPAAEPAAQVAAPPAAEPAVRRSSQPVGRPAASLARPAQDAASPSPEPVASQPPMSQTQPAAQPAAVPAANPAELEKVRDDFDMLQARATTIRNHSLWRSQAASGMGIRSDAANARSLMETHLRNATNALNSGNAASARSYMERAERQIEILEKILN